MKAWGISQFTIEDVLKEATIMQSANMASPAKAAHSQHGEHISYSSEVKDGGVRDAIMPGDELRRGSWRL